jgi:hypothetical protein
MNNTLKRRLTMSYNFQLINVDTDSVTVCNENGEKISDEQLSIIDEQLNEIFPEYIEWELEPRIDTLIVLKAKNYIMEIGGKIKLKGSSIKDQKKEPALREMLNDMISDLVYKEGQNLVEIYHKFIREAKNPTDIHRWCQKKTVTKSVLNCAEDESARANEKVVYNAIKHTQIQEGDKVWLFPAILGSNMETKINAKGQVTTKQVPILGLCLDREWSGQHNYLKLVERVYSTIEILSNVVDMSKFVDYTLKKNIDLLNKL